MQDNDPAETREILQGLVTPLLPPESNADELCSLLMTLDVNAFDSDAGNEKEEDEEKTGEKEGKVNNNKSNSSSSSSSSSSSGGSSSGGNNNTNNTNESDTQTTAFNVDAPAFEPSFENPDYDAADFDYVGDLDSGYLPLTADKLCMLPSGGLNNPSLDGTSDSSSSLAIKSLDSGVESAPRRVGGQSNVASNCDCLCRHDYNHYRDCVHHLGQAGQGHDKDDKNDHGNDNDDCDEDFNSLHELDELDLLQWQEEQFATIKVGAAAARLEKQAQDMLTSLSERELADIMKSGASDLSCVLTAMLLAEEEQLETSSHGSNSSSSSGSK